MGVASKVPPNSRPWVSSLALAVLIGSGLVAAFILGQRSVGVPEANLTPIASQHSDSGFTDATATNPPSASETGWDRIHFKDRGSVVKTIAKTTAPAPSPTAVNVRFGPPIGPGGVETPSPSPKVIIENRVELPAVVIHSLPPNPSVSLEGTVRIDGTVPPPREHTTINQDPYCAAELKGAIAYYRGFSLTSNQYAADVVVMVEGGSLKASTPPVAAGVTVVRMELCQLWPYVATMRLGDLLRLENPGDRGLVVTSSSVSLGTWNQLLTPGGQIEITPSSAGLFLPLDLPGVSSRSYVCVMEHPYFAVTDSEGRFHIPSGLASGSYQITATHRLAGSRKILIDYQAGSTKWLELVIRYAGDKPTPPPPLLSGTTRP